MTVPPILTIMSPADRLQRGKLYLEYIESLLKMYDKWLEARDANPQVEHDLVWMERVLELTVSRVSPFIKASRLSIRTKRNIEGLMDAWVFWGAMPLGYEEVLSMVDECKLRVQQIKGKYLMITGCNVSSPMVGLDWRYEDIVSEDPDKRSLVAEETDMVVDAEGWDDELDPPSPVPHQENTDIDSSDSELDRYSSVAPEEISEQIAEACAQQEAVMAERSSSLFEDKGARERAGKVPLTSDALRQHNLAMARDGGEPAVVVGLRLPQSRKLGQVLHRLLTTARYHNEDHVTVGREELEDVVAATLELFGELALHPASLAAHVERCVEAAVEQ